MKLIIIAHEASPYQGSECEQGWMFALNMGKYYDVKLIFASGNQINPRIYVEYLQRYLRENTHPSNVEFISVDQPSISKLISKINYLIFGNIGSIGLPILFYLSYKYWLKKAYNVVKRICAEEKIDIIHHKNLISFRAPGYFRGIKIPIVWGPISGTNYVPFKIVRSLGLKYGTLEILRNFSNYFQRNYSLRVHNAVKRADLIYTVSKEDYNFVVNKGGRNVKYKLETGTILKNLPTDKNVYTKIKLIWVGQLIKRKYLDVLIDAVDISTILREKVNIDVMGDGPLYGFYKEILKKKKIDNIKLHGFIEREKVFEAMRCSDIFVHTSYSEATANVNLEAISFGIPVVCHDICGMSIAITDKCGVKIPLISYEESVKKFKIELERLISDKKLLYELKRGAIERAKELSWDKMIEEVKKDYEELLSRI